ncbi:hypothetical protein FHS03_001500 [Massilia violacea]|uniref:DJ-1/PfpI domain-containing protein n=1 Tax=Pseudoduganella violacea TaxID=1715466 RepID=A0A7W5B8G3_9BURK|nr:hypothetical protein [Pseudoduganella violacea]
MSKRLAAPRRIVFVATDLTEELDLFGSVSAFCAANRSPALDAPAYRIEIVSGARTAAIAGNCGITLLSNGSCFDLRGAIDTLIVVSGEHAHQPQSKELRPGWRRMGRRRAAWSRSAPAPSCWPRPGCWTGGASPRTGAAPLCWPSAFPPPTCRPMSYGSRMARSTPRPA